jgi:response regulator RpfG family c-di-GMP phosphodiesterase
LHTILVLDEDPGVCAALKGAIEAEGYAVESVFEPSRGLQLALTGGYSLLILDFSLARLENSLFLRSIREDPRTQKIPFIFIVETGSDIEEMKKLEWGAEEFIAKPIDRKEATTRVSAVISRRAQMDRLKSELYLMDLRHKISNLIYSSTKLEDTVSQMLMLVMQAFDAESSALFLLDEDEVLYLAAFRGPVSRIDLLHISEYVSRTVTDGKAPLFGRRIWEDSRFPRLRLARETDFKTLASLPLNTPDKVLGTLELYNLPEIFLTDEDTQLSLQDIVFEVVKVIALSQRISRVDRTLKSASDEIGILYEVSNALSSTINLDEMLKLIVRKAVKSFDAQVVSIMLIEPGTDEMRIRQGSGLRDEIIRDTRVRVGEGIAGRVARTGQPLLLVDVMGIDSPDVEKNIKSALSVPLKINDEVIGVLNVSKTSKYRFVEKDLKLLYNLAGLAAQALEKARLYQEIKDKLTEVKESYLDTVMALSTAIEEKDAYTQGHVDRVAQIGMAIALELDPSLLEDDVFRYALILHDVGKIIVPDDILSKPGLLTPEEQEIMRRHPEVGAKIISPIKFLSKAVDMVKYHQERWDGGGYPEGLKGEEIPLIARIIAVADAFDAMTSNRPYRKRLPLEVARDEIFKNSGKQFDPVVVEAFRAVLEKNLIPWELGSGN